ncbi:MAG TPA: hypothetical protein VLH09_01795 [Bryobacteraceae bacterium]|nr:hypothetical protein [Bryobacteraceae bacterium]
MPAGPVVIHEWMDPEGRSPFARWFNDLNAPAAAKVAAALYRLGQGNFSHVEGVGGGVYEIKVDFGPGHGVYFGIDEGRSVLLLGGSTKLARAQRDPAYRRALLSEAVNACLGGEESVGKAILRDVINATIGFEDLAAALGKSGKSPHRMLGPQGNPTTENFFAILQILQRRVGVRLRVRAA